MVIIIRRKNMPRVTQKGQVTIPRQIRAMLSINTGDEVIFEMHKNQVVLKKKTATDRNFEKYVGFLTHLKGKKPEDIIEQLRGKSDDSFG
jgi:AbrB family looped-hinge helix DNA binding protein